MARSKDKNFELGRADRLVVQHPTKATGFTWPRVLHSFLRELASTHTKVRGSENRSKMLSAAIINFGIADLSKEDMREKVEAYRKGTVGDVNPKAGNKDLSLSDAPYLHFGVKLPFPVSITLENLKESLTKGADYKTSLQELSATAIYDVTAKSLGETAIGDIVSRYSQITVGELLPDSTL